VAGIGAQGARREIRESTILLLQNGGKKMRNMVMVKKMLVGLAVVGLCLPQSVLAAPASAELEAAVVDVALMDGGKLIGRVVDPQGVSLKNVSVLLRYQGQEVLTTKTDQDGCFSIDGLRGGVYEIAAENGGGVYRLWAAATAPPLSGRGVLIVSGGNTVRSQGELFGGFGSMSGALVVTGIVATAVSVPVAINNTKRPSSP